MQNYLKCALRILNSFIAYYFLNDLKDTSYQLSTTKPQNNTVIANEVKQSYTKTTTIVSSSSWIIAKIVSSYI